MTQVESVIILLCWEPSVDHLILSLGSQLVGSKNLTGLIGFLFIFEKHFIVRTKNMAESSAKGWGSYSATNDSKSVSDMLLLFSRWASHVLIDEGFVAKLNDEHGATTEFLDVACGWGYLSMELIERLVELNSAKNDRYKFLVTDYAEGMVHSARNNLLQLCEAKQLSNSFVDCFVMDGCHPTVAPNSISFIGCMFGIMFFPELDAALPNLLSTLQPGGVAVFGTWKEADTAAVTEAFCRFLSIEATEAIAELRRFLSIGGSRDDMVERLSKAGFVDVRVEEKEHLFDIDCTSPSLFQAIVRNPVLGVCFNGYTGGEEALLLEWQRFCRDAAQCPWSRSDGTIVQLRMVANLSIARKQRVHDSA